MTSEEENVEACMKKLTTEDPETRSTDVVAENVERLRELFPEAFTEGRVDFDVLKQLLGGLVDEREEKYGLNWHGKRRARLLALTPSTGTLRPAPEESVDWDTTQNLMIEGDNLEVLKLLQKSYAGKVKLIYIDPPYNTGKDFVYPDDFRDSIRNYLEITGQVDGENGRVSSNTEASGRFHTDWLNMMYPRMQLARNLLLPEGVMLVSIDDNELSSLRLLCDDLFGEENYVATMVWEKGRKNDAKLVSVGHEYVVVYAKSLGHLRALNTQWREEKPGAHEIWDEYEQLRKQHGENEAAIEADLQAWYSSLPTSHPSKKWSRYKRIDRHGPWRDRDISWPGGDGPRYDVIHPTTGRPCKVPDDGWRFSKPEEMQRQIGLGLVEFREDHTEPPFRKAHLRPLPAESLEDPTEDDTTGADGELATQVRGTYFYKQSQVAVKALRKLLGAKVFNNPKDHEELANLFHYVTAGDSSAVVLDFFAGSGSTAHAVWELNHRDHGARRHILIQLPEPLSEQDREQRAAAQFCKSRSLPLNIAELTKERLRRAGQDVRCRNPLRSGDLGFRVFKLDHSNIRTWDPSPEDLEAALFGATEHLRDGRSEQDVLYELLLKLGLDLCVPIEERAIAGKTVYSVGAGTLFVCIPKAVAAGEVEKLALGIAAWHEELAPAGETTAVFRDSAFENDVAKTNLAAILEQHGLENVRSL